MEYTERMIADYKVCNSIHIGQKEIAVGENPKAPEGERFLCCYIETVAVFERYTECVVSDDFAEIIKIFGERIASAAEEIRKEIEEMRAKVPESAEITEDGCNSITREESIENKVVVIKGSSLQPEYRYAPYQIMLCTGGFGAQTKARGRTCYCVSLYDGKKNAFSRSDILGTIEPEKLPAWAKLHKDT